MIVLLTGHRKSGTTLLHRLFDDHKNFNIYPNDFCYFYMFFPSFSEKFKNDKSKAIKRLNLINKIKLIDFCNQHNFNLNNFSKYNKILKSEFNKKNIFNKKILFDIIKKYWISISNMNPKKDFLFKETSQTLYFENYNKMFRNFKMINIIRDPRDNLASILDGYEKYYKIKEKNKNNIIFNFIFTASRDLKFAKIYSKHKNFLNIKYEDLILYPNKTLKKVCEFLRIENKNLNIPTIFGKNFYGNNFKKKIYGISESNIGNWKKRLNANEKSLVNHYFKDPLKTFGYENSNLKTNKLNYLIKFNEDINFRHFFKDYLKVKKPKL